MTKKRLVLVSALLVLILAVGIALGILGTRAISAWLPRPQVYNTSAIVQQVRTLSELATVQYVIEKVIILEDVKWIAGLGENRVLMVAHGRVKAGLDLSSLEPGDITLEGKRVQLKLPPAQILDTYLVEDQTRVIERTTGLLRMFDKDLEQNARRQAVDDIRRAARQSGILTEAEKRARAQLELLFSQMGLEVEFE